MADFYNDYLLSEHVQRSINGPYILPFSADRNFLEIYDEYFNSLRVDITKTFFYRSIQKQINIDEEWDDYVETWLDNGGRELIRAYDKINMVKQIHHLI